VSAQPAPGPGLTVPARRTRRARVLLVDDHDLIREGLRRALDRAGDLEVVGEARSVSEAEQALARLLPEVMVTDIRLPDGDGLALTARTRAQFPKLGIVVLTMYAGDEQVIAAMDAGASSFVGKDAPTDDVVAAARRALATPRDFVAKDLEAVLQRREASPVRARLSPREREVLLLLADGLAIAEIAKRLFIGESTAKTHVAKIYDKLGAANRAQAVMAAVRLGLVDGSGSRGSSAS
jgi:DNA-binding NarL/FixJ family response regulator